MPNYQKLTIEAERALLDQQVKAIEEIDSKLKTKDIAQGPKASLEEARRKRVVEIGQAIDKVLNACDVAEHNNRVYCQYISDAHAAAKLQMDQLEPLVQGLERAWNDRLALGVIQFVGQVEVWAKRLKTDDEELRSMKMVDEYRGNGWKTSITAALKYAPDRAGEFATRDKNRLAGIELSTKVAGQRNRVGEYVTRAQALQKTASALGDKAMGVQKDLGKLRDELIDYAEKVEKDANGLLGEIVSTTAQVDRIVKAALGVKTPNKETYKPALLFEPKIDVFIKDCKGTIKTMRVVYGEESKKGVSLGERYSKLPLQRADTAIKKLEAATEGFVKNSAAIRKVIEVGKKFK
jgi:hypothetical protein